MKVNLPPLVSAYENLPVLGNLLESALENSPARPMVSALKSTKYVLLNIYSTYSHPMYWKAPFSPRLTPAFHMYVYKMCGGVVYGFYSVHIHTTKEKLLAVLAHNRYYNISGRLVSSWLQEFMYIFVMGH